MTCLARERGREVTVEEAAAAVRQPLEDALGALVTAG
jgi:hypothetical protein